VRPIAALNTLWLFGGRFPYLASEIFACDVKEITDALLATDEYLNTLWDFLDGASPLPTLQASYFSLLMSALLVRQTERVFKYIQGRPHALNRLLSHLETPAISEFLQKLVISDDYQDDLGVSDWLAQEGLIRRLVELLSPHKSDSVRLVSVIFDQRSLLVACNGCTNTH
jgi:serine/threonine-protein phosphatase 6 regulatory subunit 3